MAASGDNRVLVAFASGSEDLIPTLIERLKELEPRLPLFVVSEFAPAEGRWIPYHPERSLRENHARRARRVAGPARALFRHHSSAAHAVLAPAAYRPADQPRRIHRLQRKPGPLHAASALGVDHRAALLVAHGGISSAGSGGPGGHAHTFVWRLCHPWAFRRPLLYLAAVAAGWLTALAKSMLPQTPPGRAGARMCEGISVVVPSRNGKHLLATLLPGLRRE